MDIVVSGVRPTNRQHIGNYFGAVKNFVEMQSQYNCYFFVADYHSLTTHPHPADLSANVRQTVIEYLACGLDPEKCVLYRQSDVPQIPELYLVFNMLAYLGELERAATFKEKVRSQPDNVNAGLLTYPVLMAVDIIVHRALKVPVGKDQLQHLEMTRTFANRFNHLYGVEYFPEPQAFSFSEKSASIPSLDGEGKMSKSKGESTVIYLDDDSDTIRKKMMRAKTDTGPTEPNSVKSQSVQNLFDIMQLISSQDTYNFFNESFNNCTIRYGDFKKQLGEDMVKFIEPIRERIKEISANEAYINKVLNEGGEKARLSASKTLNDVREIIGFRKF
ncbi:MAG: tryptophan--tRNA ligase [Chitinophagales bacterium]|nr:tryptophan--tRNA ligase [Chitinophagales bacterium]OJV30594.1 MAG: tryptophan--tRNA ligase [Bacteroidetes bacterium 37-13]HRN94902.1 tryptophan--tRNA ligase [Chitinophagales bacterium]HRP38907.1 tryptophan--tRNA ligase [Chitinophagales bacterium]